MVKKFKERKLLKALQGIYLKVYTLLKHPHLSSDFIGNYLCRYELELLLTLVGNPNWVEFKILAQAPTRNLSISDIVQILDSIQL